MVPKLGHGENIVAKVEAILALGVCAAQSDANMKLPYHGIGSNEAVRRYFQSRRD